MSQSLWQRVRGRWAGTKQAAEVELTHPTLAIVTDSAAALPTEWIHQVPGQALTVIPLTVTVDGEVYFEGDQDLHQHLSLALAAGKPVQTSRPSPGVVEKAYAALAAAGFTEIVSIHLSAELSGTVEAARLAAQRCPIPVTVVDSRTVGMAQGLAAWRAHGLAAAGSSAQEVADSVVENVSGTDVYFYVPSLEQLRRGGRIGSAASWIGSVLAIKPILAVTDGKVVPLERIRTAVKARARLVALTKAAISQCRGACDIAIHYFGNRDQAEQLAQELREAEVAPDRVILAEVPAVLAAHVGLGVMGTVVAPTVDDVEE